MKSDSALVLTNAALRIETKSNVDEFVSLAVGEKRRASASGLGALICII